MVTDYEKNKDTYLERAKKTYERSKQDAVQRLNRMVVEAKARAKKRGILFTIENAHVKWNDVCPIFPWLTLKLDNSGAGGAHNSPSLDKIENDLGYVPGNVRIISNRANKLKNDMTYEECEYLYKNWHAI